MVWDFKIKWQMIGFGISGQGGVEVFGLTSFVEFYLMIYQLSEILNGRRLEFLILRGILIFNYMDLVSALFRWKEEIYQCHIRTGFLSQMTEAGNSREISQTPSE